MGNTILQFRVGGLQPLTMIDFPGKIASVLFAQGCNFRCRFCYNRSLLPDTGPETIEWDEIITFLKARQGFVEGVVFSGGEPCYQPDLLKALAEVKELGFATSLHSNGYYPEKIKEAIKFNLVDYIAIDFKTIPEKYEKITGCPVDKNKFLGLAGLIADSGVPHEYRTTVHPQIASENEIVQIARLLAEKKIAKYVLQKFEYGNALDKSLPLIHQLGLNTDTLSRIARWFNEFEIRGDDDSQSIFLNKAA
jgi:anaerobic ribonucleoside-triphosphate reductase activating protein